MGHVTCLEASRIFGDGYFVNLCVSVFCEPMDGAAKPSFELISLVDVRLCFEEIVVHVR